MVIVGIGLAESLLADIATTPKRNVPQTCYSCDSTKSVDCLLSPNLLKNKTCPHLENECYTFVKNDVVLRGCTGDLIIATPDKCKNPFECKLCSDKVNCNNDKIEAEQCISCDSTVDPTCHENSTFSTNITCLLAVKAMGCFHEKISGHTKRGCMSGLNRKDFIKCNLNDECKFCFGNACNSKENFQKCYICNSALDLNCASNYEAIEIKTCKKYDDECFTFVNGTNMKRGCLLDLPDGLQSKCKRDYAKKCEICSDNAGNICNTVVLSENTCIECDSSVNSNCRKQTDLISEAFCSVNSSHVGCFTNINGNSTKRGCMHDLPFIYRESSKEQTANWKSCPGKNCNKKVEYQRCYSCNGLFDSNCATVDESTKIVTCKYYMDQCVIAIDSGGQMIRRCSSNETLEEDLFHHMHEVCPENNCNKEVFPKGRLECFQCAGGDECTQLISNATKQPISTKICNQFSENDRCYAFMDEGK